MDIMTQTSENRILSDKFMLRLPDGMRNDIKRLAETNHRSMNAEIVAALEMHLYASGGPDREYSDHERKISDLSVIVAALQTAKRLLIEQQGADIEKAGKVVEGWNSDDP